MVETQSRGRRKGGSGMIDASTLAPLRALAGRVLELCDIDAACVLMIAQGKTPTETAAELSRICAPGGEADRLADVLEKNPQAAKDYAARLLLGLVDVEVDAAADHHGGKLVLRDLFNVHCAYVLAQTDDGAVVRGLLDLLELVGDDDNALAVGGEAVHYPDEVDDLLRRQ